MKNPKTSCEGNLCKALLSAFDAEQILGLCSYKPCIPRDTETFGDEHSATIKYDFIEGKGLLPHRIAYEEEYFWPFEKEDQGLPSLGDFDPKGPLYAVNKTRSVQEILPTPNSPDHFDEPKKKKRKRKRTSNKSELSYYP